MTVETKSFLDAKITSSGHEKSAKFLKDHKSLVTLLLAFILLLFCASISILQIWMLNRMQGMQQEIDHTTSEIQQLKNEIADMRKNMGFDDELFDDLKDFDKEYNQNDIKEEIDLDDSALLSDGKNKFDDVGDDDESEENSDEFDDNYDASHSGYGYEDDDEYDMDPIDDDTDLESQKQDDNNIYKDMTQRKTRSITGLTEQGVPILEEPYVSRRNRTKTHVDDYVTNILLPNNREKDPKLKLTWNGSNNGLRREHHIDRNSKQNIRHHHSLQNSNRFAFDAAPVQHSYEYPEKKKNVTTSAQSPSPIQTRKSRVMHVEDRSKAFRQVVRKDDLAKLAKLQEFRKNTEHYVHNLNNNPRRRIHSSRRNLELKNGKRARITAVHYNADSSSLVVGRHHNYEGNAKVKLNKNEYIHWQPAAWVSSHGMDNYFSMDSNGMLTVRDQGIFLIYSQVFYSDDHDTNGYVIEHNNHIHYQCTTMTHTTTRVTKTNSCYTSGLINLKNGDKIQIKDIGNHRSVLLEPSKSYFGLIKINLVPHTAESSEVESFNAGK